MKKFTFLFLFCFMSALSSGVFLAQEKFQGRLIPGLGGGAQKAMKLVISVESYTTTYEVFELIDIFNNSGFDEFKRALHKLNKGTAQPTGGRGVPIVLNAAQSLPTEKGRQILLISRSQSWDLDTRIGYDGRFPFMVIEINLNEKGKGSGKIYLQADIKLTKEGIIELGPTGSPPKQLVSVTLQKK
jgi:hypothetical protein